MPDGVNFRILGPVVLGFSFVFGIAGLLVYRLWDPLVEPETGYQVRATLPLTDGVSDDSATSDESPDPLRNPTKPTNEYEYLRLLEQYNVENKSMALELAFAGEDWYAEDGLAAEARRAMQVRLLVDVGRAAEARKLATRFIQRFPDSSYLEQVREAVGLSSAGPGERAARGQVSLTKH